MSINPIESSEPAYKIETERVIIRCYDPFDAFLVQKSVQESVDHILPWISWANREPEELQAKITRLRQYRANFDKDVQYEYGIFNKNESELIGGCWLNKNIGFDALEIGFWINVNHINKGYATEISKALVRVAFEIHKVNRVEIHCNPKNRRSANIPKKLGFEHEATLKNRSKDYQDNYIDLMIWSLFKENYQKSSIFQEHIQSFDAIGNRQMI